MPNPPTLLVILDGWGYRADYDDKAIAQANTPAWDSLWQNRPHCLISGSGTDVGLPAGQMGNSEVGHMNLGAGRVVHQDFTRINQAIDDASFYSNPALQDTMQALAESGKALHLFGLLSPGGVHSHERQIKAAVDRQLKRKIKGNQSRIKGNQGKSRKITGNPLISRNSRKIKAAVDTEAAR